MRSLDLRTVAVLVALGGGCGGQGPGQPAPAGKAAEPAAAEAAKATESPPIEPLTEEELRLIAADPTTLSPEEKRKRAYAQHKKIMQNPDSPLAKSIRETQDAVRRGEIPPPDFAKNRGGAQVLEVQPAAPDAKAPSKPAEQR